MRIYVETLLKIDPEFFLKLKFRDDGIKLWNSLKCYNPIILSGCTMNTIIKQNVEDQISKWCADKLVDGNYSLILCKSGTKGTYCAGKDILIDDRIDNGEAWMKNNGIFYRYEASRVDEIINNVKCDMQNQISVASDSNTIRKRQYETPNDDDNDDNDVNVNEQELADKIDEIEEVREAILQLSQEIVDSLESLEYDKRDSKTFILRDKLIISGSAEYKYFYEYVQFIIMLISEQLFKERHKIPATVTYPDLLTVFSNDDEIIECAFNYSFKYFKDWAGQINMFMSHQLQVPSDPGILHSDSAKSAKQQEYIQLMSRNYYLIYDILPSEPERHPFRKYLQYLEKPDGIRILGDIFRSYDHLCAYSRAIDWLRDVIKTINNPQTDIKLQIDSLKHHLSKVMSDPTGPHTIVVNMVTGDQCKFSTTCELHGFVTQFKIDDIPYAQNAEFLKSEMYLLYPIWPVSRGLLLIALHCRDHLTQILKKILDRDGRPLLKRLKDDTKGDPRPIINSAAQGSNIPMLQRIVMNLYLIFLRDKAKWEPGNTRQKEAIDGCKGYVYNQLLKFLKDILKCSVFNDVDQYTPLTHLEMFVKYVQDLVDTGFLSVPDQKVELMCNLNQLSNKSKLNSETSITPLKIEKNSSSYACRIIKAIKLEPHERNSNDTNRVLYRFPQEHWEAVDTTGINVMYLWEGYDCKPPEGCDEDDTSFINKANVEELAAFYYLASFATYSDSNIKNVSMSQLRSKGVGPAHWGKHRRVVKDNIMYKKNGDIIGKVELTHGTKMIEWFAAFVEKRIWSELLKLCMYDIIYDGSVSFSFIRPFEVYPINFKVHINLFFNTAGYCALPYCRSQGFYKMRKERIDVRTAALSTMNCSTLQEYLQQCCDGLESKKLKLDCSIKELISFALALGGVRLGKIFQIMTKDPESYLLRGLPDLVLWKANVTDADFTGIPTENRNRTQDYQLQDIAIHDTVFAVEVKSHSDTIKAPQVACLEMFRTIQIKSEVLKVENHVKQPCN